MSAGTRGLAPREQQRLRVLYVEPASGLGGSTTSLASFIARMDREKFEPIVALTNPRATAQLLRGLGVEIHRVANGELPEKRRSFPLGYVAFCAELLLCSLPLAVRLARLAKRLRVSIIHLNTDISSNLAGVAAGVFAGVPVVAHLRSIRELRLAERMAARLVRKIIVISETGMDFYRERYPGLAGKLVLVHNVCELREPDAAKVLELRESMGISESTILFTMLSNFVPGKGHDTFIRAAAPAVEKLPTAKFALAGGVLPSGAGYYRECRQMARDLGLGEMIFFLGWRDEISELLDLSAVVVDASSLPEGFRQTVAEAATAGKAIIATDVGSARRFLLEGKAGVIVPPKSAERLAEEMVRLGLDASERSSLGKAARERARALLSAERASDELSRMYLQVSAEVR